MTTEPDFPLMNADCPGGHVRPEHAHITPGYWYVKVDYKPGYSIVKVGPDELKRQHDLRANPDPEIDLLVYSTGEEEPGYIDDYGVDKFLTPVPGLEDARIMAQTKKNIKDYRSMLDDLKLLEDKGTLPDFVKGKFPNIYSMLGRGSNLEKPLSESMPFADIARRYNLDMANVYMYAGLLIRQHLLSQPVYGLTIQDVHRRERERMPTVLEVQAIKHVESLDREYKDRFEQHLIEALKRRGVNIK